MQTKLPRSKSVNKASQREKNIQQGHNVRGGFDAKKPESKAVGSKIKTIVSRAHYDASEYAVRLIDPGNCELGLSPSTVAHRGVPMRQVIEANIQSNYYTYAGANTFYGEVHANLNDTLLLTTSNMEANHTKAFDIHFWGNALTTKTPSSGGYMYSENSQRVLVACVSLESGVAANSVCFPFVVNTTSTGYDATVKLDTPIVEPIQVELDTTTDGQVWVSNASVVIGSRSEGILSFVPPNTTIAIRVTLTAIQNGNAELIEGFIRIQPKSGGVVSSRLGRVPMQCDQFELDNVSGIAGLQQFRVIAQDVLGTCQASSTTNGGRVAAARVPRFWTPSADVLAFNDIAKLSYDKYDGPFMDGFHVHWLPASLSALDTVSNGAGNDGFGPVKIVFAGSKDTASSALRVKVSTIVEFFSIDPTYGHMPFTLPFGYTSEVLYILATSIPAATSNKEHIVSKMGALLRAHAPKAINWVLENPEKIAQFTALIAALL